MKRNSRRKRRKDMKNSKYFAYPYCVWMVFFIAAPMLLVVYYAFINTSAGGDGGFTLKNFSEIFTDSDINHVIIFLRSLLLAAACTAICLLVGYPVAYLLADRKMKIPAVIVLLFIMPMWMNFLLRTYATMNILSTVPLLDRLFMNNINGVLLGMVYNYLPFMILPIYSSLSKMDPSLIEAASDLGASPRRTFWKIVFPLSAPGVVSGITMVFMPAVSTFAIATLIGGSKVTIIGDIIQRYFGKMSTWGIGSALSVVLMLFIIISMLITAVANARSGKQKQTRPKGVKNHA